MAPTPDWNPGFIKPIQDNWSKIEPVHKTYVDILGGLGSIFGFASAIALVVRHNFQPPKWPFTSELWNPKPTAEKKKEEKDKEVTEEELLEDELAAVAGGVVAKRSMQMERDQAADEPFSQALSKRENVIEECEEEGDKVKNKTSEIGEEAKSVWETVEEDVKELVKAGKEVAEEVWDDVKGIFGQGEDEEAKPKSDEAAAATNGTAKQEKQSNSTATAVKRHRRAVKFVD